MRILHLNITDFRNFSTLSAEFSGDINLFYGSNGSGKTNLLEALFVLCLGRSQRSTADALLVRSGADVYRLEGSVQTNGETKRPAVAYQRNGGKKITIDQATVRISELYEQFAMVSSGPEDSAILSGSPSVRRSFMDIYLSQLSGAYLRDLIDYHKALTQKNAALKRGIDPAPFDPILISIGSRIIKHRLGFVSKLQGLMSEHYLEISGGEEATVQYQPSVPIDDESADLDEIETAFQLKLDDRFVRERAVQTALVGPHRDELYFEIGGFPARTFGSQGQWRTAAICAKLAMYDLLRERRGSAPVLLLDEIFAELDSQRTMGLIDSFRGFSQLFLTTASEPPEALKERARTFRIHDGEIEDIA